MKNIPLIVALCSTGLMAPDIAGQNLIRTFPGPGNGSLFGLGVQVQDSLPDVDGDRVSELVIGAPGANLVQVVSGGTGRVLKTLTGANPPSWKTFGHCVSTIGDVNKDGAPDFAVGYPSVDSGAGGRSGRIHVYSGKPPFAQLYTLSGTHDSYLGTAIAPTGDIDGDQVPDFLAGASHDRKGSLGVVYACSGRTGKAIYSIKGSQYFGSSIHSGADVDGDGLADFVVGLGFNSKAVGHACLYSAKTGNLLWKWSSNATAYFGAFVQLCGDLDGDSVSDVLVGDGVNRLFAYSGKTGATLWSIAVTGHIDLETLGDIDLDGCVDFAIGQPFATGPSGATGSMTFHSGRSGALLHTTWGRQAGEQFGRNVERVPDFDGDDLADLLVSAPRHKVNGQEIGVSRLFSSRLGSFAVYGQGCAGTANPPRLTAPFSPSIGKTFRLVLSNLKPRTGGLIVMGNSDKSWNGMPLPLDLSALGMGGCRLLVSWDAESGIYTLSGGTLIWSVTIPPQRSLVGIEFHCQAWVHDPAANSLGVATSNAGKGVVGY